MEDTNWNLSTRSALVFKHSHPIRLIMLTCAISLTNLHLSRVFFSKLMNQHRRQTAIRISCMESHKKHVFFCLLIVWELLFHHHHHYISYYKITEILRTLWLVNRVPKPMFYCTGKPWFPISMAAFRRELETLAITNITNSLAFHWQRYQ